MTFVPRDTLPGQDRRFKIQLARNYGGNFGRRTNDVAIALDLTC